MLVIFGKLPENPIAPKNYVLIPTLEPPIDPYCISMLSL